MLALIAPIARTGIVCRCQVLEVVNVSCVREVVLESLHNTMGWFPAQQNPGSSYGSALLPICGDVLRNKERRCRREILTASE